MSQMSSNRGTERAAGSMQSHAADARSRQEQFGSAIKKDIRSLVEASQVTAFDHCGATKLGMYSLCGPAEVFDRLQAFAKEDFGFRQIGSHERGQREQILLELLQGRGLKEPSSAGGNHDRIDHQSCGMVVTKEIRDKLYDSGGAKHSGLHRFWGKFSKDGLKLAANDPRRTRFDSQNAAWILGGDCGYRAGTMDTERSESL